MAVNLEASESCRFRRGAGWTIESKLDSSISSVKGSIGRGFFSNLGLEVDRGVLVRFWANLLLLFNGVSGLSLSLEVCDTLRLRRGFAETASVVPISWSPSWDDWEIRRLLRKGAEESVLSLDECLCLLDGTNAGSETISSFSSCFVDWEETRRWLRLRGVFWVLDEGFDECLLRRLPWIIDPYCQPWLGGIFN